MLYESPSPFLRALQRWDMQSGSLGFTSPLALHRLLELSSVDKILGELLTGFPPPRGTKDLLALQQIRQEVLTTFVLMILPRVLPGLFAGLQQCESPIEELFLYAFLLVGEGLGCRVFVRLEGEDYPWGYGQGPETLVIIPQAHLAGYRIDFLVTFAEYDLPHRAWLTASLAVECDGHSYHDATPEQAQRDRTRDRILQTQGYHVFRYTGAELYADPFRCAEEAILFVIGRAGNEGNAQHGQRTDGGTLPEIR